MDYSHIKRWTMPDSYFGKTWPDYYSAYVQHRDSDALARSNFASMLKEIGGESETVLIVRESHWAVGWVEWIAIHESNTQALEKANAILEGLEDYPVVNDDYFSETEQIDAEETWKNCYDDKGKLNYIREHRDQFEFKDYGDLIGCARGRYFAGCASELLY